MTRRLTLRERAEAAAARLGAQLVGLPYYPRSPRYEVHFPDGKRLEGCSSFVCTDLPDVLERLRGYTGADYDEAPRPCAVCGGEDGEHNDEAHAAEARVGEADVAAYYAERYRDEYDWDRCGDPDDEGAS